MAKKKQIVSPAEVDKAGFTLWLDRNIDRLALAVIGISALVGLLLFNVRLNEGGDDSTYICRALDLIQEGRYPSFQGPLYPMFLSVFVWLSGGVDLIVLKLTSLVLLIGGQTLMYFSLRRVISRRLLVAVLILMMFNMWFMEFGSLTYSEPFFYALQWLLVWALLKLDVVEGRKKVAIYGGVVGLLVVSLFLVRTVGFVWGLSGIAYLLLRKSWKKAGAVAVGCLLFFGIWSGVKALVWGEVSGGKNQMETLLQVDPYDPSEGLETPMGYVTRFVNNSDLYISKHYCNMLGLRDAVSRETNSLVTIIIYAIFLWGTYCAYRKNRGVLFIAVSTMLMVGATFFSLQILWDQYRLILPYVAMMHIVVLYGLRDLIQRVFGRHSFKALVLCIVICTSSLGILTLKRIDLQTLRANLNNNQFVGYTPDWYNYLGLCYAIGHQMENVDEMYVACRKPDMARIYAGGKKFYGIFTIPSNDPDELVENLRQRGVTHCVIGSLRRDPAQKGAGVINTMHRYMNVIVEKYPYFLMKVCQVGAENDEPAVLYKLHYENANTNE